ncbi:MAG: hypothetical protein ACI802_003441 [Candidatus Paceibacteria bacterium]|jgi:hypothetical protein
MTRSDFVGWALFLCPRERTKNVGRIQLRWCIRVGTVQPCPPYGTDNTRRYPNIPANAPGSLNLSKNHPSDFPRAEVRQAS